MFQLLWPTVRPAAMIKTYQHWMDTSSKKYSIKIRIAVNTHQQRNELMQFEDVLIIGEERRGPVYATNALSHTPITSKIIILVSDDFFSPVNWDEWLYEQFQSWDGAILVDDSLQCKEPTNNPLCMTIPIMTKNCLEKVHYIYHPDYLWQYSDNELYNNLIQLNLLKDLRQTSPTFEHRHWGNNKRICDDIDQYGINLTNQDKQTYDRRMALSLEERLK